jgi:ADP-ribose pyrophosphatase YjhB (NUDIX family)
MSPASGAPPATPGRTYPDRPIVGVGAVVVLGDRVVLVRRRHEPLAGRWSLPGGGVELGETLAAAVTREVREETGLDVEVGPLAAIVDRIHRDAAGRVAYHYVLVDYVCTVTGGALAAGDDAADVALAGEEELARYDVPAATREVVARGLALARSSTATRA